MKYFILILFFFLIGCRDNIKTKISPLNNNPLYNKQWYLNGSENNSSFVHINYDNQFTGKGITIALVDNGVQIEHPDLLGNIGDGNYNYLASDANFSLADHGTACAGVMVATDNDIGIRGIAYDAKIVAYNALQAPSITALAHALTYNLDKIDISSNSWGDFNSWGEPFALRTEIKKALKEGITKGRDGKGIIYLFAGDCKNNCVNLKS
jgi:subtilisin family serine protease